MFKNFWWPLEFSHEVTDKPRRLLALGLTFALYRTPDGKAVVMSDVCVHRGGSLSGGKLSGDCIVCPYHGWEYQSDGACARIPANAAGVPIPKKARVDSYPTQEKYGWVWAYLGDLPESERPPLPTLPNAEEPNLKAIYGEFKWNANYERVVENGLDIAHAPFVHSTTFGNPDEPEVQDFEVQPLGEWGGTATVTLKAPKPRGLWGMFYNKKDRPGVKTTAGFVMPCITILEVVLPIGKLVLWDANIPVDDHTTITKWISMRTFFRGDWADKDARKRVLQIFEQDKPVVEAQRPELVPLEPGAELSVRSDTLQIAYRRLRRKALQNGWALDRTPVQKELMRPGATVIPSPARRELGEREKSWVHHEVPMQEPEKPKV
jgi:phenylpropionate dioxygenase-like ring-hydroxylating dioxygenase large terminal subunit